MRKEIWDEVLEQIKKNAIKIELVINEMKKYEHYKEGVLLDILEEEKENILSSIFGAETQMIVYYDEEGEIKK